MWQCEACGHANEAPDRFCGGCGRALSTPEAEKVPPSPDTGLQQPQITTASYQASGPKNRRALWEVSRVRIGVYPTIILILALIAIPTVAVLLTSHGDGRDSEQAGTPQVTDWDRLDAAYKKSLTMTRMAQTAEERLKNRKPTDPLPLYSRPDGPIGSWSLASASGDASSSGGTTKLSIVRHGMAFAVTRERWKLHSRQPDELTSTSVIYDGEGHFAGDSLELIIPEGGLTLFIEPDGKLTYVGQL